jgi:hypothetical protein
MIFTPEEWPGSKSCKFRSSKKVLNNTNTHYLTVGSNILLGESEYNYRRSLKLPGRRHSSQVSVPTTAPYKPSIRILNTRSSGSHASKITEIPCRTHERFPKLYLENRKPNTNFTMNSMYKNSKAYRTVDEVQMVKDLDEWESSVLKKLSLPARREPFLIRGVKDLTRLAERRLLANNSIT